MKEIQKRMLVQIVLGFLLGRVNLWGMNPIGLAYFASGYAQGGARLSVGISVLLGMLTALPAEQIVVGALAMTAVVFAADLLEKRNIVVRPVHTSLLLFAAVGLLTGLRLYLTPHTKEELWLGCLETALVLFAARALYDGIHFLLHAGAGQSIGNEEGISLILLGGFVVLGLPDVQLAQLSVLQLAVYFLVLFAGYVGGAGLGAAMGAIGGCALLFAGQAHTGLGVLPLLGICAGMLRMQGRWILCSAYFVTAAMLSFLTTNGKIEYGSMESAAAAGAVFLIMPKGLLGKIQLCAGGRPDSWENERLQRMMQYKLMDFSRSFQSLSETIERNRLQKMAVEGGQTRVMIDQMSSQVCRRCENYTGCRGQLALQRPEMLDTLVAAQEQGQLGLEQMPVDFMRECIHQERFLSEANQNIYLANAMLGFQNRMLQNQSVIAEQMREVGNIVGELSQKLPVVRKISPQMQEAVERELRKKRIFLTELAFYEKFDGRLQIHLRGKTWRGRYVTTREVEETLSSLVGRRMLSGEECRKVFPREEEDFVFEECPKLRTATGVSRLAKDGEEISGDTFSCMYLPSGEFLAALSDGMGSGREAYAESESVMELLERMTEAGFSEQASLRLINSLYLSKGENGGFATADIVVLNLYQKSCHFVKCGACTTFLFHADEMERIEGEALPIGVMNHIEPYLQTAGISAGDYVIMMTDGVEDCFLTEECELENLIWEFLDSRLGPQDMADRILEEALARLSGKPEDDMSVLVVKLYENA